MHVHDWTRVAASTFHDFHTSWITHLKEELNQILPRGYYAQSEQHIGPRISDVLTLHVSDPEQMTSPPEPPEGGAVAVEETPPKVSQTLVADSTTKGRRRTLTIRHTSGHRIIAFVEILSPSNKASEEKVVEFVNKAVGALRSRIHLVIVDVLPPGKHDPEGMHAAIWEVLDQEEYELPADKTLTLASYSAGPPVTAYLNPLSLTDSMKDMPLFLTRERYVNLPLRATYGAAIHGMPAFWRDVLEGSVNPRARGKGRAKKRANGR